jgi:hypothetical protein
VIYLIGDRWKEYLPITIKNSNRDCTIIQGTKAIQLEKIEELFSDGKVNSEDCFLVTTWFPGLENLRYLSHINNTPIKIFGIWNGGSNNLGHKMEPMHDWSKYFEIGFLNICNGVFVGTEYTKNSITERLLYSLPGNEIKSIADKLYAFGMPIDLQELSKIKKEKVNQITFPFPLEEQNYPNVFIDILNGLSTFWEDFDKYNFVFCSQESYKSKSIWLNALIGSLKVKFKNVTVLENLTREKFLQELCKSSLVVSTTAEENFDYPIVESLAMNSTVLCPNGFVFPEILEQNKAMMYDDYDELFHKIPNLAGQKINYNVKELVAPYGLVVNKWCEIMDSI